MNNINSLSLEVLCDDEVPTLSVPPITAIDPRPNHDDEVSSLSFMGDSDLAQDRKLKKKGTVVPALQRQLHRWLMRRSRKEALRLNRSAYGTRHRRTLR